MCAPYVRRMWNCRPFDVQMHSWMREAAGIFDKFRWICEWGESWLCSKLAIDKFYVRSWYSFDEIINSSAHLNGFFSNCLRCIFTLIRPIKWIAIEQACSSVMVFTISSEDGKPKKKLIKKNCWSWCGRARTTTSVGKVFCCDNRKWMSTTVTKTTKTTQ